MAADQIGMRRPAEIIVLALVAVTAVAAPAAARTSAPVAARAETGRPAAITLNDLSLLPGPDTALDTETGGVRVSVQPGGGVWQSAVVTNRGREPFTVQFGGSDWLNPAALSVVLEPGQSETMRFTVAPPASTEPGESVVDFVAAVEGKPDVQKSLPVVVTVLAAAPTETGDAGAAVPTDNADAAEGDESTGTAPARGNDSRLADFMLFVLLVGGVGLLVTRVVVAPIIRALKRRRRLHLAMTQIGAKLLTRLDARRIRRIVDASAALGDHPEIGERPTRAEVRHAKYRERVAIHRKQRREADARVREEARRLASTLWADRIRAARELAEQEAAARMQAFENARRRRAEIAAELAEERRVEESKRLQRQRQLEAQRLEDSARRAQARAAEIAAQRAAQEAALLDAVANARDAETERRTSAEVHRARSVGQKMFGARRTAIAWGGAWDAAQRAQATRTPPLPGEDGTMPPPELLAPVAFLDPLTGTVARPDGSLPPAASEPQLDVTALDIAELNRQLAAAPSQGTRAASAQSRSKP